MARDIAASGLVAVYVATLFLIEEVFVEFGPHILRSAQILIARATAKLCTACRRLKRLNIEHLLRAQRADLVHVGPVDEHPVLLAAHYEALFIHASAAIIHHAAHARPHSPHKRHIAKRIIIIRYAHHPVKRVVEYGVYMLFYRVFAAQCPYRALSDFAVHVQATIDEIALIRIARPNPAIALYTVQEELPAVEVEGVCRDAPYVVQLAIRAVKFPALFQRQVLPFGAQAELRIARHKYIPERARWEAG